jgi:hypothetical protein
MARITEKDTTHPGFWMFRRDAERAVDGLLRDSFLASITDRDAVARDAAINALTKLLLLQDGAK